jgi:outer membrane receptor protein involved in Fe transport
LVGGYFAGERANESEDLYPIDATNDTVQFNYPTAIGNFTDPVKYQEWAGFANLDFHVTPTFDVAAGGRYSTNHQSFHETEVGLFGGPPIYNTSKEGVFTYSGDVRWHFTPDNMFYARIATGFVPGGPNDAFKGSPLPTSYGNSSTTNYEIGVKNSFLDDALTFDVSAFEVDWRDIQLYAVVNGLGGTANGGAAKSDGVEWDLNYVPISGLTLGFNGSFTDARLTQATPASVGGNVGDRLPGVPLWSESVSANYERPLFGDYSGFVGANWRFTGSRYSDFIVGSPRLNMPNYNIVDLRVGLESDKWSFTFYVKNVGNSLAINYIQPTSGNGGLGPQSATVYTPRTIGAELTRNF